MSWGTEGESKCFLGRVGDPDPYNAGSSQYTIQAYEPEWGKRSLKGMKLRGRENWSFFGWVIDKGRAGGDRGAHMI